MKKISSLLLVCIWLQPITVYGAEKAKVVLVKGQVTKLLPGAKNASPVKRGDVLPEDTSVLTGEKSIVRLKFADNSSMNLGPKSKVVVSKLPKDKPNMINLLTGAVKAEVDKNNKKSDNKMIVKTRSAVMGVRGTKFQATYNHQNNNTSLVTVEGKVAMVNKAKIVEDEAEVLTPEEELDKIDEALNTPSENIVEVDAGKYAGVQAEAKAPTTPVKIAPVQYEALAKSMGHNESADEVMKTVDAKEEIENLENAPRPGGYVDFETGIYVPPAKDAKLDEKTATFTAKDMGEVDKNTGDYIPPKGVKLDAKKGFVIENKEIAKVSSANMAAVKNVTSVNDEVKQQVGASQALTKKKIKKAWYSEGSHTLSFRLAPFGEKLLLVASGIPNERELNSSEASDTHLTYEYVWNDKWTSRIRLGGVDYRFENEERYPRTGDGGNEGGLFMLGAAYKLNNTWTLEGSLNRRQMYFFIPDDFQGTTLSSSEFGYIRLGGVFNFLRRTKWNMSVASHVLLFGEEKVGTPTGDESIESYGADIELISNYYFTQSWGLDARAFGQFITHDVTSANDAKFERSTVGLSVGLLWNI